MMQEQDKARETNPNPAGKVAHASLDTGVAGRAAPAALDLEGEAAVAAPARECCSARCP